MTDLSGRASSGARSVLRALLLGATVVFGLLGGCGSNNFTYGTAIITFSSDPSPFTAYIADISSFYLVRNDGAAGYTFQGTTGVGKTIDFTKLADQTEFFGAPAVLEGTYTSAVITFNYAAQGAVATPAQIYVDVNGQSQFASPVTFDTSGNHSAAGAVSLTVKFDPAHPLVIQRGAAARLDMHFDQTVSTVVNSSASPLTATVRPFMTASTEPVYSKPMRVRGEFVTNDSTANSFSINAVSFFDSASYTTGAQGAIAVQVSDQTTYNVNGTLYTGAAGLAAINALALNTNIAAYGTIDTTSFSNLKPTFIATQVYAGLAVENLAADRVIGTVAARSGNTLTIHNADLVSRNTSTLTGVLVNFYPSFTVTVGSATPVSVDGQPTLNSSIQSISIGQQVDLEGQVTLNSSGTISGVDASNTSSTLGLVRLSPSTAWGTLNAAPQNGTAAIKLVTLGGADPSALTFTGTGSATGADADPTAYAVSLGTINLSTTPVQSLLRVDGNVTSFGSAPPDFTASAVTPGSSTDQVLTIDWPGTFATPGTVGPFASISSSAFVLDLSNSGIGTSHHVYTGPVAVDLKTANANVTIVPDNTIIGPDGAVTGEFAIGNPTSTTDVSVFHAFGDFYTQVHTVLNGTNTIRKLVAVGHYDPTTNTFTAHRIDMIQLP